MKVAIPHHDGEVTPCFEYTAGITIYSIRKNRVMVQTDFSLQSKEDLDRIRLLRDQGVTVLICSGIQTVHKELLLASGIQVLSRVSGKVSEVLRLFLRNRLAPYRLGGQFNSSDTVQEEESPDP